MKRVRIKFDSINFKLVIAAAFVIFPIIILLLIESTMAIGIINQQSAETNELLILPYIRELDTNLENAKRYVSNSSYLTYHGYMSSDDVDAVAELADIKHGWSTDFLLYPLLDGIYMYSADGRYLSMQNPKSKYDVQVLADDYIKSFVSDMPEDSNPFENGWTLFSSGDRYFIMCSIRNGSGIFGVWISLDTIRAPLDEIRSESISSIFFTDNDNNVINDNGQLSAASRRDIVISERSAQSPIGISAVINRDSILRPTTRFRTFSVIFSLLSIGLFLVYFFYLKFSIIRPIEELANTMNSIVDDTIQVEVNKKQSVQEFRMLFQAFDRLLQRIRKLKIDVYEEKINKQRAQMQFLQLQIKPHFFLNSLNVILSFFDMGENEMAERMLICLAKHFRYLLHDGSLIEICEEIEHTKNYLLIQQMRFERNFVYDFRVDDELMDKKIPLLSIQTFVENSVKHITNEAITPEIVITITQERRGADTFIKILIRDNGEGFTPEILEKLNRGEQIVDEKRKHIGIYNVRQRIDQIYAGRGRLLFYNGEPRGAVTEILIPLTNEEEEES